MSTGKRKNGSENDIPNPEGVKKTKTAMSTGTSAGKTAGKSGKKKAAEEAEEAVEEEKKEKEDEKEEDEIETPVRRWHKEVLQYETDNNLERYIVVGVYEKIKPDSEDEEEEDNNNEEEEEEVDEDALLSYEQILAKVRVVYARPGVTDKINQYYRNICNSEYRYDTFSPKALDRLQRQLKWSPEQRRQVEKRQEDNSLPSDCEPEEGDNESETDCHGTMFNTHSSHLMRAYLDRELDDIEATLKAAKKAETVARRAAKKEGGASSSSAAPTSTSTASASAPGTSPKACAVLDELLPLTVATKAFTFWYEDTDNPEHCVEIAKRFGVTWRTVLKYSDAQLGIDAGSRVALGAMLDEINEELEADRFSEGYYGDCGKFQMLYK